MVKRNVWMALSVAALVLATPRTGSAGRAGPPAKFPLSIPYCGMDGKCLKTP